MFLISILRFYMKTIHFSNLYIKDYTIEVFYGIFLLKII